MKKGILLVANKKSQNMCVNLIYSIRKSGCKLPIKLVHFGGEKINSQYIMSETEFLVFDDFPEEAQNFVKNLRSILTDCPNGYLYRFLGWFIMEWDEFLYSDNDIVALCNWTDLFEYINDSDLLSADEEYTTEGRFNYDQPMEIKQIFGEDVLLSAFTAGHFIARKTNKMIEDMIKAVEWFKNNPNIAKQHDQALLHVASLIGKWKIVNLCKPPYYWLSSWSGDYTNTLDLILNMNSNKELKRISHIHYSGGNPTGTRPIEELLYSSLSDMKRVQKLFYVCLSRLIGILFVKKYKKKSKTKIKNYLKILYNITNQLICKR
ncbi:MAG: alpha-1,3-mannosyltransferase family protein [Clostridiales Family XIII bacterium]|jgi:hypothetical protein|nr:alpha-1,3-mannosyltransferase family protein [Clostridiales Family XIII bacterium]